MVKKMKKFLALTLLASVLILNAPAFASTGKAPAKKHYAVVTKHKNNSHKKHHDTHGSNGEVTPKSIGAGALSLLIWPGIGQLMNDDDNTEKAAVHAILGFTGIFRIWSCYDAVVDRKGGVWDNRI